MHTIGFMIFLKPFLFFVLFISVFPCFRGFDLPARAHFAALVIFPGRWGQGAKGYLTPQEFHKALPHPDTDPGTKFTVVQLNTHPHPRPESNAAPPGVYHPRASPL